MIVVNCSPEGVEPSPGLKNIVSTLESLKFEVKTKYLENLTALDIQEAQGIVLSGARRMLTNEPKLIEHASFLVDSPVPILGICFGHQLLGAIHKAKIYDRGSMLKGFYTVSFTDRYPLFCDFEDEAVFEQEHQQYIDLPKDFILCASSAECKVEAMRHESKPFFGVQFHPERHDNTANPLFYKFARLCREHNTQSFMQVRDKTCSEMLINETL